MRVKLLAGLLLYSLSAINARSVPPAPVPDVDTVTDTTPDSLEKARTARPVSGSTRIGHNPVLFLVGNSTMRTGTLGNGDNGQWGWGYFMQDYFDRNRITVENHALGGMSSRTFNNVLWADVLSGIRPGDWVIIELGHNDTGPYDSGRARASLPGTGRDSLMVTIKETGRQETVYSYGEYMRRFVRDVKARGATPILFSLTPRNAWADRDSTVILRVADTFGGWARLVADEENVPFVDLNELTARKYEKFGKEKVKNMFYLDRIHTSEFGARVNAESAVEGLKVLDSLGLNEFMLSESPDTLTGSSRKDTCPVVFVIGDSTVKNEDSDSCGMWGWGSVLSDLFDTDRISVENHAMAGRSARTFLDEGRWDNIYKALRPGDYVLIQFGHNDGGDINTGKARGELHGAGDESRVFHMEKSGRNQVVYTYGWYLRKFIMDAREKGAVPIVLSHTPRNKWKEGIIESNSADFGLWARQAAKQAGAMFIDLNAISGRKLQALGQGNTEIFFKNDHTHSSLKGARLNAESIAEGLRGISSGLEEYLKPFKVEVSIDGTVPDYNDFDGYGFDYGTRPCADGREPYYFSFRVPDGNYVVTLRLGDSKRPSSTFIRAERRRKMSEEIRLDKKEYKDISVIISKRSPAISISDTVLLNDREKNIPTWDGKLTVEITGKAPAVGKISLRPVEPADSVTTIYLCGNSTVVDQAYEPWASWGQIIPAYFDRYISISNHAESGESASSFIREKRLDKILSSAKPGDWLLVEFGHNDQKERGPGTGAYYNFASNLKIFVDRARESGLNIAFITPTVRRFFDENGSIMNTHGDYPAAVTEVAVRENVPLIDLNTMTQHVFSAMGPEASKHAYVHYPAGSFSGQNRNLADNTHFNPLGATLVARCVLEGIRMRIPELAEHILFPESMPDMDNYDNFYWPVSVFTDFSRPYGN